MRLFLTLSMLLALPAKFGTGPQKRDSVSLDVGSVTIWLGMTEDEAARKFRDAGYSVTRAADMLLVKGTESHVIWFKNGRLVFADQGWNTSDKTDVDAVIEALGDLAEKAGNQSCMVVHSPLSSPNSSGNRVFVSCGERSVLIGKGTIMGKPFVDISERIGTFPAKID